MELPYRLVRSFVSTRRPVAGAGPLARSGRRDPADVVMVMVWAPRDRLRVDPRVMAGAYARHRPVGDSTGTRRDVVGLRPGTDSPGPAAGYDQDMGMTAMVRSRRGR